MRRPYNWACAFIFCRNRLCIYRHRFSAEHLLHRDFGLGTLLPLSVLSARASLGKMQSALEYRALYRGHSTQEQDPLAGSQRHQLYLPCHRVLGVSIYWQSAQLTCTLTCTHKYTKKGRLLYLACVKLLDYATLQHGAVYFYNISFSSTLLINFGLVLQLRGNNSSVADLIKCC